MSGVSGLMQLHGAQIGGSGAAAREHVAQSLITRAGGPCGDDADPWGIAPR